MKTKTLISSLVVALSFGLIAQQPANTQKVGEPKLTLPRFGIKTPDDLRKVLDGTTWYWNPEDGAVNKFKVRFTKTAMGLIGSWSCPYEVKSLTEITMKEPWNKRKTAHLIFSTDFSSFSGTDFGGIAKISGNLIPETRPKPQ